MKHLSFLVATFCLLLCSCNHNEPPLEITLPISDTYIPLTIELDEKSLDEEQKRNLIHLVNNDHIVNSAAELPEDPMGFGEAYDVINFKNNTLLIKYILHDYSLDTYNQRYYRNTKEKTYNWVVNVGTASGMDHDTDRLQFTRFAILVNKLPADANFKSWYGLTSLGWFPEK